MSLQAQPKASSKRAGKRVAFFNEQGIGLKEAQQQHQQHQQQQHLLKEGQYYSHGGSVPSSQAMELSKSGVFSGVPGNAALLNSLYQDRGEVRMIPQQLPTAKWQNSLMGHRLPERSDAGWQPQPGGWNHGMVYGGSQKGGHPNANVPTFYSHPDSLKRNREKGMVVSQLDLYGDVVKAQLEQQVLARQQAHMNQFQQMQKQQQQQQQQQQNQTLPLQPFQLAFGHQGQKQGLPELLHVFQQPPTSSSPAFTAQQKQQALPQLQLFENFYPQQQQQQQQLHQQAAAQAFGMQQQPASVAQPHVAAPPQPPQHHMTAHQFHPVPERNQELLKALTEHNAQAVLPQAQIPLPRRSRRLSKEGVLPVSSAEEALLASKPPEDYPGNVLPHHWQPPQHPDVQFRHQSETFGHNKESYSQLTRTELDRGEMPSQPEMEKVGTYEHAGEAEKQVAVADGAGQRTNDFGGVRGGVIQSTRRRRRVSQEANLLTLAQKAVELASLQNIGEPATSNEKDKSEAAATAPRTVVEFASSSPAPKRAREDSSLVPLIIPVSVPVRRLDSQDIGREKSEDGKQQLRFMTHDRGISESKASVIVTRRRSNRNLNMDPLAQHEGTSSKEDVEGFARKPKQRPRPEPLFIPPKAGTFIAPPVYSNITPYQSHLRSPVRLADHPSDRNFELPPYTPPPILSPVREGSGLYFNAILSASGNSVPPPMTPKSAHRTLLRSNSAEVTPPVLSVMGECTPVSIEPRINVGSRFQAEIPLLRDRSLAATDRAKEELVWQPWEELETNVSTQENVENLLTAACSSIFPGGGTNQELAFHCLHEAKGNILAALTKLLLKRSVRSPSHPLADYHYTGSDKWSALEKKLFNKGIAIYKKDFFLVQKLIKTKTVGQCVEFYYTYKKQVKIGRNGTLIFGDVDAATERAVKDEAEVDIKSSHRLTRTLPPRTYNEDYENTEDEEGEMEEELAIKEEVVEGNELHDKSSSLTPPKPTQPLHTENQAGNLLMERFQEPGIPRVPEATGRASRRTKETPMKYRKTSPPAPKRRRKPKPKQETPNKVQNQEEEFPCKKCGRIFYKVKSRSAHMKSHAEQEKKAAALKQREKEEAEAAAAAEAEAARRQAQHDESSDSGSSSGGSSSSSSSDEDGEV